MEEEREKRGGGWQGWEWGKLKERGRCKATMMITHIVIVIIDEEDGCGGGRWMKEVDIVVGAGPIEGHQEKIHLYRSCSKEQKCSNV